MGVQIYLQDQSTITRFDGGIQVGTERIFLSQVDMEKLRALLVGSYADAEAADLRRQYNHANEGKPGTRLNVDEARAKAIRTAREKYPETPAERAARLALWAETRKQEALERACRSSVATAVEIECEKILSAEDKAISEHAKIDDGTAAREQLAHADRLAAERAAAERLDFCRAIADAALTEDLNKDGVNWEDGGRVYQLMRGDWQPRELTDKEMSQWKSRMHDYMERHGTKWIPVPIAAVTTAIGADPADDLTAEAKAGA